MKAIIGGSGAETTRCDSLTGSCYAIEEGGPTTTSMAFGLCAADARVEGPAIAMAAVFSAAELIAAAEASAPAVDLDVGGIGVTIDDGAGIPRSDDIRPPPDFVARPVDILG